LVAHALDQDSCPARRGDQGCDKRTR
jgi:hypothetical protein